MLRHDVNLTLRAALVSLKDMIATLTKEFSSKSLADDAGITSSHHSLIPYL